MACVQGVGVVALPGFGRQKPSLHCNAYAKCEQSHVLLIKDISCTLPDRHGIALAAIVHIRIACKCTMWYGIRLNHRKRFLFI